MIFVALENYIYSSIFNHQELGCFLSKKKKELGRYGHEK